MGGIFDRVCEKESEQGFGKKESGGEGPVFDFEALQRPVERRLRPRAERD